MVSERLWRQGSGRVGHALVIPGCETSVRSVMEVHFSYIFSISMGSFTSVAGGVGSFDWWWILGQ